MLRRHFIINTECSIADIPNDEIWYTSSDNNIVTPYDSSVFGANIINNTYEDDKGVITFDGDVTTIGYNAFEQCSSLTFIVIPESVASIDIMAFIECSSLTSIVIPDNVTYIYDAAFYECSSLTSVTIPNSVTYIAAMVFYNCSSLNSITFEGTIEQWNNVRKNDNWNDGVPATVVHCTDGDIEI